MNNIEEIKTKICKECHCEKLVEDFYKRKDYNGYRHKCKLCITKNSNIYYKENIHKVKERHSIYSKIHKKENNEYAKLYRLEHKKEIAEKNKAYRLKHKTELSKKRKQYCQDNRDKIKKYRLKNKDRLNKHYNDRRSVDINFKLRCNLSRRFRKAVKQQKTIKSKGSLELLGCSLDDFRKHLESQFKEGMSWENHTYKGWHMDHIKPCALFDLTDPKQKAECFHYSNYQPLWWQENLKKGDRCVNE